MSVFENLLLLCQRREDGQFVVALVLDQRLIELRVAVDHVDEIEDDTAFAPCRPAPSRRRTAHHPYEPFTFNGEIDRSRPFADIQPNVCSPAPPGLSRIGRLGDSTMYSTRQRVISHRGNARISYAGGRLPGWPG